MDGSHISLGVSEDTGVHYLEIIGVTLDDQGSYTCQITTPVGTLESTGVLTVLFGTYVHMHVFLCVHVFMWACVYSCVHVCACLLFM